MNNNTRIKKAVFPVAGMGTRFLPATKANPKEMMPIVDKPLIQYAVEEAISAGIKELIFVTSSSKRAIEDHFDRQYELEARLQAENQIEQLKQVRDILPEDCQCIYIRQSEPLGLGHAIGCAESVVGNEPFAVLLADDLIEGKISCLQQMVDRFAKEPYSLVAVENIAPADTSKYGVIDVEDFSKGFGPLRDIVEKPQPDKAPSHFGVVGRYLLTPEIFNELKHTQPGAKGEIQLTDAIQSLLHKERVNGYAFAGRRFDCGSKLGYLQAIVSFGQQHPEVGNEFEDYLRNIYTTTETC